MNEEQKQRMTHELGQWNAAMKSSCSVSDLLAISTRMATLLQDLIEQPTSVPVLTVECEPDYWSGGHYHEGTKPHIDQTAVWKLPIGTKLYTAPAAPEPEQPNQSEQHLEMVRDAERYRWLLANYAFGDGFVAIDSALNDGEAAVQLSPAIDAAIAAEKGGA